MIFRKAEQSDIKEISELRKKQIQDEGQTPDIDIDEDLHRYFEKHMGSGQLLEKLEEEARARGITRLLLHASEAGRKAYLKSGYVDVDYEMEKDI